MGKMIIFSNQELCVACAYQSKYLNKVIKVNLNDGSFTPIKVEESEWGLLDKHSSFDKWVKDFSNGPLFDGLYMDREKFHHKVGINALRRTITPDTFMYKKYIDGDWHSMIMDILPIDQETTYILVKDLDKFMKGETDNYGLRE